MSPNELVVDGLTVEYAAGGYVSRPIERLDLRAKAGSLVLLLGPSGCGKTTLLSCLAGIQRPTAGTIRFGDIIVTDLDRSKLTAYRRHQVGIVFQAFNLVSSLTAAENVMMPLRSAGVRTRPARERAEQLLAAVELTERARHRPGQLSGGQQQRVAIARSLALNPGLVLADEPTAHLDHGNVEGVLRLLRRLTTDGRIVVLSTHDDRLLPLADQIVELAPRANTGERSSGLVSLPDGALLFRQGDPSDWVYTVVSGAIEILLERDDGSYERVSSVAPDEWFGEMGPLFRLPRSATARANGPTVVEACSLQAFRERLGVDTLTATLTHANVR